MSSLNMFFFPIPARWRRACQGRWPCTLRPRITTGRTRAASRVSRRRRLSWSCPRARAKSTTASSCPAPATSATIRYGICQLNQDFFFKSGKKKKNPQEWTALGIQFRDVSSPTFSGFITFFLIKKIKFSHLTILSTLEHSCANSKLFKCKKGLRLCF